MIDFNFFLWPMLLPLIIPIAYCIKNIKASCVDISLISFSIFIIVVLYWPLTLGIRSPANLFSKFLLFIIIPIILLSLRLKNKKAIIKEFELFGLTQKNIKKSTILGFIFIPLMVLITVLIQYYIGFSPNNPDVYLGIMSFFESFTEEFFFRGILFIFLISKTNFKIAYSTSLSCFILAHPQNLTSLFIIGTLVQGIITLEICRRSQNLIGSWMVHGTNRLVSIVLLPFLF